MKFPIKFPPWLIPFLIGPLVMGFISILAWYLLAGGVTRMPKRIEYIIPSGTAKNVAAGENLQTIPEKAIFVVGDELVLKNEDDVPHQIGPFWVPANSTISTTFNRPSMITYACSVHSSGLIGVEVQPQNSLLLTLLPTLALGVPLGGVMVIIMRVMKSL